MKKSDKTKVNPLDQIGKRIEKYTETYDSPVIHDPLTNSFKTEKQFKHEAEIKENNRIIDTLNKYEDMPDIPKQELKLPKETKDKFGYTPSQNRQITQHLTRNKDISKRTPPATATVTSPAREQSSFIKHRQKLGEVMRNQKDKKVVLLNKPKPFKINFNLNSYDQPAVDADVKLKKEKLDRLRKEKEKVDPDLFRGLGTFLHKKI